MRKYKPTYHHCYAEHLANGDWVEYEYKVQVEPDYHDFMVIEDVVDRTLDGKTWEEVPFSVLLEGYAHEGESLKDALDRLNFEAFEKWVEDIEDERFAHGDYLYDRWKDEGW